MNISSRMSMAAETRCPFPLAAKEGEVIHGGTCWFNCPTFCASQSASP